MRVKMKRQKKPWNNVYTSDCTPSSLWDNGGPQVVKFLSTIVGEWGLAWAGGCGLWIVEWEWGVWVVGCSGEGGSC